MTLPALFDTFRISSSSGGRAGTGGLSRSLRTSSAGSTCCSHGIVRMPALSASRTRPRPGGQRRVELAQGRHEIARRPHKALTLPDEIAVVERPLLRAGELVRFDREDRPPYDPGLNLGTRVDPHHRGAVIQRVVEVCLRL